MYTPIHRLPALFTTQSILPSASTIPRTTDATCSSWVTSSVLVMMFGTPSSSFILLGSRAVAYTLQPPRFANPRHLWGDTCQCCGRLGWASGVQCRDIHTGALLYRRPSNLSLLLLSAAWLDSRSSRNKVSTLFEYGRSWVHFDAKHRQDYRIGNFAFAYFNSFPEYAFLRMIEP